MQLTIRKIEDRDIPEMINLFHQLLSVKTESLS